MALCSYDPTKAGVCDDGIERRALGGGRGPRPPSADRRRHAPECSTKKNWARRAQPRRARRGAQGDARGAAAEGAGQGDEP